MISRKKSSLRNVKYIYNVKNAKISRYNQHFLKSRFGTFSGGSKYENECQVIKKSQCFSFKTNFIHVIIKSYIIKKKIILKFFHLKLN